MARARLAKCLAVTALIGSALPVSSCVEDEGMFYAYQLAPIAEDGTATCEDEFTSRALVRRITVIDADGSTVTLDTGNSAAVCLQNKIKSSRNGGVETSNIIVREYNISFSDTDAGEWRAISGSVPADSEDGSRGLEGGRASMFVSLFGAAELDSVFAQAASNGGAVQLVAGVIFRGRTTGGMDVETPEWFFPVDITSATCFCDTKQGVPACTEFGADAFCKGSS